MVLQALELLIERGPDKCREGRLVALDLRPDETGDDQADERFEHDGYQDRKLGRGGGNCGHQLAMGSVALFPSQILGSEIVCHHLLLDRKSTSLNSSH